MLTSAIVAALASAIVAILFSHAFSLKRNIRAAKQSGLPYIIVPVYFQYPPWLIGQELLWPILNRLPGAWKERWLPLLVMKRLWHESYTPFATVGADTFMAVSSTGKVVWTCEPEAVTQFCARRNDFPKSLDVIEILNMFGPTVTATEGPESRLYRKVASPAFNESTHSSVWSYTLQQVGDLMRDWNNAPRRGLVDAMRPGIANLTLRILSFCAYGKEMRSDAPMDGFPAGHQLSYSEAIASMLENATVIFLTPPVILKYSPLKVHQKAYTAFVEARRYMQEMSEDKVRQMDVDGPPSQPNLLDALVEAAQSGAKHDGRRMTDSAVLGNIFIFILAGHETSANTAVFALTLLACFPSLQRAVQEDLDRILGSKDVSEWSYADDLPKLIQAYPGALLDEILRLYTVVPFFPKITGQTPQLITLQGKQHAVPPETLVLINTNATHRNPKHWPQETWNAPPLSGESDPFPLSSFAPDFWLKDTLSRPLNSAKSNEQHHSPTPGSYVPFSEGPRSCMGQRFAKTEFVALLTRILKFYTVELSISEAYVKEDPTQAWKKTRQDAAAELSKGVVFFFALKMGKEVPVQFVPRG